MNNRKTIMALYLPAVFILTAAATVLRTVAVLGFLDAETGYFEKNTYIVIADVLIVCAVALGASYLFVSDKKIKLIPSFGGGGTYIPAAAVSLSMLFLALDMFARYSAGSVAPFSWLSAVVGVFALLSIVGFFLSVLSVGGKSERNAWFGIATVVFLIVYSAYLYFDSALPLNSTCKNTDRTAYLAAAAFFIFEARLSLGREKWWAYMSFAMIGTATTAYSAVPSLVSYLVNGEIVSNSLYESILTLALCAFITLRALMTANSREDKESPLVALIKESEASRAQRSSEISKNSSEEEPDNYTIEIQTGEDKE